MAKANYGWVGSAINSWIDLKRDVFKKNAIASDIERATRAIKSGVAKHYGPLDVMHDETLDIGACFLRSILDGTNSEIDAGYIHPDYDTLAEAMVGKEFTMSHSSQAEMGSGGVLKLRIGATLYRILMKTPLRVFTGVSVQKFTVARPGAEANPLTTFRVFRLSEPVEVEF